MPSGLCLDSITTGSTGPRELGVLSSLWYTARSHTYHFCHHSVIFVCRDAKQLYNGPVLRLLIVVFHIMHNELWHNNHDNNNYSVKIKQTPYFTTFDYHTKICIFLF